MPTKINFKVYQGSTFKELLRWETSTKVYVPITAISKSAPITITAPGHTIPVGWRVKVTSVTGMKEINSADIYHVVTSTSTDTVVINAVNAIGYTDYVSGGVIEYNAPNSLAGVTARMQIRSKITDELVILELTTENGGITIDDTAKTITMNISAAATTLLTFASAVYSMELINGSEVTPFINGVLTLEREITR